MWLGWGSVLDDAPGCQLHHKAVTKLSVVLRLEMEGRSPEGTKINVLSSSNFQREENNYK